MSNSLNSILSNAASGLNAAQAGIATVSDNIANAGVAGYTAKTQALAAFDVGNQVDGVNTGLITRSVDAAVQASVWSSASTVGALTVRAATLNAITTTQGTVNGGTSLADALSTLQAAFTTLQSAPSDATEQATVVADATTLADTINGTASTITTERNSAQSQIVSDIGTLNTALGVVQTTTGKIMAATAAGQSTSSLEDTRDSALQTLSGLLNLTYDKQANGDITLLGQNGFSIPLNSTFSTAAAVLSPATTYSAGGTSVPAIEMQSINASIAPTDVTRLLTGGSLGEAIQQRDVTLPAYTTALDQFSAKLANKFSAQGLTLFTDGSTTTPLTASAGLSSAIEVNPAVTATPSLVRDGTAGTLNSVGAASYTGLIDNVVNNSFSATGTNTTLATDAQSFVSQQAAAAGQATTDLTNATAYQTTVTASLSNGSGVNVDNEMGLMIQLQNSYQANARVVQATQTMFTALVNATASAS